MTRQLTPYHSDEYMLRIARDLLDQQIIDVNGRKVVRVNDVTFEIQHGEGCHDTSTFWRWISASAASSAGCCRECCRRAGSAGCSSAFRRTPSAGSTANMVEPDPQRRLRLNISHTQLEEMHPADLADIVEELGPAEREAIFETIDSEVAADALSEVDPEDAGQHPRIAGDRRRPPTSSRKCRPTRPPTSSPNWRRRPREEILEEMDAKRQEPRSASCSNSKRTPPGGLMNTEYVALHDNATVTDALAALRGNEELLETLNTLFLVDARRAAGRARSRWRACSLAPGRRR